MTVLGAGARFNSKVTQPIILATLLIVVIVVAGLAWVTRTSDAASVDRQVRTAVHAIDNSLGQLAHDQEVVAIWDDPVIQLRSGSPDWQWFDDNVAVWLHDLFGHNEVYILDAADRSIYAMIEGKRASADDFTSIRPDLQHLVEKVRGRSAEPAHRYERLPGGRTHPAARLQTSDKAVHASHLLKVRGRPAVASIMTIQPLTDAVPATPGAEPLIVSVRFLDGAFLRELGERNLIEAPRFSTVRTLAQAETAIPIASDDGDRIGWFIWRPERPGTASLRVLGPLCLLAAGAFVGLMLVLITWLRRAGRELVTTVTFLQASEAMAIAERERAEAANAAKSDFLATISHEIRTPLNAVVSAAHFLNRTDLTPLQAEHVEMLSEASNVLLSLINDVLDLSRIEAGKLAIEATPVELGRQMEALVALWQPRASDKGLALTLELADDLPECVVLDPLRVKQVLFNLLSNAVKFTDAGSVTLKVRAEERASDVLVCEVVDTGPGIPEQHLGRLFEAFEQADAATTRRHGGSGLGLAICRRLAVLMGGELHAESTVGQGSAFRLELPLVVVERKGAPTAENQAGVNEGELGQLKLLVAEDHPANRRVVELMLEPFDCILTFACNGQEAVEAAAAGRFDVILMDMQMPVMDGIEATRRIRAGGPNAETPIIALTANAMAQHLAAWAEVGVHALVSKPIDPRLLTSALTNALSAHAFADAA